LLSTLLQDSTARLVLAVIWLKVLLDGSATDPEFAGEHGFRLAGSGAANECGRLSGVQRLASSFLNAGLLGQRDAFALSLSDKGSFELGERSLHGK